MDAEYEKICLYCEHAAPSYDSERMLCDLRGIVGAGHKCRKFIRSVKTHTASSEKAGA